MDRIQFRRDALAQWSKINPVLLEGEVGFVLDDPNKYKVGDGIHAWNDLPLRGFNGNVANNVGDSEDSVISQKFASSLASTFDVSSSLPAREHKYYSSAWRRVSRDASVGEYDAPSTYQIGDKCNMPDDSTYSYEALEVVTGVPPYTKATDNKYNLSEAIAALPAILRRQGIHVGFIDYNNEFQIWESINSSFTSTAGWQQSDGKHFNKKLSELGEQLLQMTNKMQEENSNNESMPFSNNMLFNSIVKELYISDEQLISNIQTCIIYNGYSGFYGIRLASKDSTTIIDIRNSETKDLIIGPKGGVLLDVSNMIEDHIQFDIQIYSRAGNIDYSPTIKSQTGEDLYTKLGSFISGDGSIKNNDNYKCTGFLAIDRSDDIKLRGYEGPSVSICSFFDKNRNFISRYVTDASVSNKDLIIPKAEIPTDAVYIRCSSLADDNTAYVINKGIYGINHLIDMDTNILELVDENKNIINKIYQSKIDLFYFKGSFIDRKTGDIKTNSAYKCTGYLLIDKSSSINIKGYNGPSSVSICSFYDKDYRFIDNYETEQGGIITITINPHEIPANAVYIRCSADATDNESYVYNKALYLIESIINDKGNIQQLVLDLQGDIFSIKGQLINKKDGVSKDNDDYKRTNYLYLNHDYPINVRGYEGPTSVSICSFYDENKNFISSHNSINPTGINEISIPTSDFPTNAVYIRCTALASDYRAYMYNGSVIQNIINANNKTYEKISDSKINQDSILWEAEGRIREQQLRIEYANSGEKEKWYGVEWKEEDNDDNVIPISSEGDNELHTTLPIQSRIRRCVTKNGVIQYYLHSDNSELKADGSPAKLDGTDGNVMVEIPEFFYKCEEEISSGVKTVRLKISEQGLPGFIYSRRRYTSAYEATIDRDNNLLVSVCTTNYTRNEIEIKTESASNYIAGDVYSLGVQKTAERLSFTQNATKYRGGTNNSTLDNETDTSSQNYSRNQLGIPIANVNRLDCKNYSNPHKGIFMYQYDTQKAIWVLAQIEFKTRNIQKSIEEGGLGMGATVYPNYAAYEKYFSPQRGISCIPCGITNVLGNKSGEVYFKMVNVPVEATGSGASAEYTRWGDVWMPVMSYRGIENFYGHIYKIADQVDVICKTTGNYVDGHEGQFGYEIFDIEYYYEPNPYLTDTIYSTEKKIGEKYTFSANIMCVKSLLLGENAHILHTGTSSDKDYTKNYCDCSEYDGNNGDKAKYITFNGRLVSKNLVGFHFIVAIDYADGSSVRPSDGTRLDHF